MVRKMNEAEIKVWGITDDLLDHLYEQDNYEGEERFAYLVAIDRFLGEMVGEAYADYVRENG